jgi:hypothetical protein
MPRHTNNADKVVRQRWGSWLQRHVGDGEHQISVAKLAAEAFPKGRASWLVYEWIRGSRTVSADKAFAVGRVLRNHGLTWCSGSLALMAAGHIGAFVCSLGDLVQRREEHDTGANGVAAIQLALLAEVALADEQCAARERAREILASAPMAERFDESRVRQGDVDRAFRFAFQIGREESDVDEAVRGVVMQLEDYAHHRAHESVRAAAAVARLIRDEYLGQKLKRQGDERASASIAGSAAVLWRKPTVAERARARADFKRVSCKEEGQKK